MGKQVPPRVCNYVNNMKLEVNSKKPILVKRWPSSEKFSSYVN
jgi:hypothetical protein